MKTEVQKIRSASKTYFSKTEYIGSSSIAAFWNNGQISPDKLLDYIRNPPKPSYAMELGNAWELLIRDVLWYEEREIRAEKGLFGQAYFVHECPNTSAEPEDENGNGNGNGSNGKSSTIDKIIWCLYEGKPLPSVSPLTAKGEQNKKTIKKDALIRDCNEHPGMIPVYQSDFDMLLSLAQKLMKTEVILPGEPPLKVADLLLMDGVKPAEYQKQIFWESVDHQTGLSIKKKAMLDCLVIMPNGRAVALDFKCYAEIAKFIRKLKYEGAWIQDIHYLEGLKQTQIEAGLECPYDQMVFLVGEKKSPFLCQAVVIDPESRERKIEVYQDACREYLLWDVDGRREIGHLKQQSVRIF